MHETELSLTEPGPRILGLRRLLGTPVGRKLLRYSATSVICLIMSETLLLLFSGVVGWSAGWSSTLATGIATVPAYFLNRQWVWSRRGRSHLRREIVPFWALAIIGWAVATFSVKLTDSSVDQHHVGGQEKLAFIGATYLAAYGVLWVAKFVLFNKVLFTRRAGDAPTVP